MTAVSKKAIERNRRYQKARTRAYRELSHRHWEEFKELFNGELQQLDKEPTRMRKAEYEGPSCNWCRHPITAHGEQGGRKGCFGKGQCWCPGFQGSNVDERVKHG